MTCIYFSPPWPHFLQTSSSVNWNSSDLVVISNKITEQQSQSILPVTNLLVIRQTLQILLPWRKFKNTNLPLSITVFSCIPCVCCICLHHTKPSLLLRTSVTSSCIIMKGCKQWHPFLEQWTQKHGRANEYPASLLQVLNFYTSPQHNFQFYHHFYCCVVENNKFCVILAIQSFIVMT